LPSDIPDFLSTVALASDYNREMATPAVKLEAAVKQKPAAEAEIKEVIMDVTGANNESGMEGGGVGKTRRRRRGSRRQRGGAQIGEEGSTPTLVEKEGAGSSSAPPVPVKPTAPVAASSAPTIQAGGAKKVAPVVVIAPPKKKAPKVTLVPKVSGKRAPVKKTFKAKRVRVLIKNRKTVKRQQQALAKVDSMSEGEVRTAAVAAGLTRQDANAPVELLRKMLRDYQTMRGGFL